MKEKEVCCYWRKGKEGNPHIKRFLGVVLECSGPVVEGRWIFIF